MWLDYLEVERRPRDREVASTSLAHCAVEYDPGKPLTHTCLCHQAVLVTGR